MLVPQGMAYALLAGLPPIVGLYASTVPIVIYALFGSSPHLAVGPTALLSLLTFAGVSALATPGSAEFVAYAAVLMLLVGILQAALGFLRAGFLANFLSHAVISGFTSAAAVIIALSQLKHLFGVPLHGEGAWALLVDAIRMAPNAHVPTLILGLVTTIVLILGRRIAKRLPFPLPVPLLVIAGTTMLVSLMGLDRQGIAVVGQVPAGLPGFALPPIDVTQLPQLLPIAVTIALIGFVESMAVGRALATKHRIKLDANRELVGLGLANVVGAFFRGYPVTGGFSRSAVNEQAGARTPLAGIITAALIALTLVFFTNLFTTLPNVVLAAIVIVAVLGLVDFKEPFRLWRIKRADAITLGVTFLATLTLGVELGILIGVSYSLLVFVVRSAWPHRAELGWLPEEGVFRNVARFEHAVTWPEVWITRPDASLYFANMASLENAVQTAVAERPGLRAIILDFSGVNDVDAVAIESLEEQIETLAEQDIEVHLAGVKGPVRDLLGRAGWPERLGSRIEHLTLQAAVASLSLPLDPPMVTPHAVPATPD